MDDEKGQSQRHCLTLVQHEVGCPEKVGEFEQEPGPFGVEVYVHHGIREPAVVEFDSCEGEPAKSGVAQNNSQANFVQKLLIFFDRGEDA